MGDRQRGWWWKQSADGAKGALTFEGDGDSRECCGHFFVLERVTCGMEDVLEGRTWEAGGWVGASCSPPDCEGRDWQLVVAGESRVG